jgi:hypothetical protein
MYDKHGNLITRYQVGNRASVRLSNPTTAPSAKALLTLSKKDRAEAIWHLEAGLPVQGPVAKKLLQAMAR